MKRQSLIIQSLSVLVLIATVLTAAPAEARRYAPRSSELIADASNGRILHGMDIYSLRHPASLTKVMTLYLTFAAIENGRFSMNTYLPVSSRAEAMPKSKLGLEEGSKITVRDCVLGLITESANDAAVVLAEAIGGSESHFAQIMTAEAKALGMKRTIYRNANGLPNPDQVTTAFDQAILTRAMMVHFPQYYGLFSTEEFAYNGVDHRNHNHLMENYEGMDGLKTGFINASGFNLIASAKRSKQRLIGIVFGGKTARGRDSRMAQLLDAGFGRLYAEAKGGTQYAQAPAVQTTADAVDVTKDSKDEYQLAQGVTGTDAQGDSDEDDDAKAAPVKKASVKKSWGVQIGSYNSRKKGLSAIHHARKKSAALRSANTQLVQVKAGRNSMYRARLGGLSEEAARNACSAIGTGCLTLPPRG
jgi:D-alanyl-D-alanine carboxypeptidase